MSKEMRIQFCLAEERKDSVLGSSQRWAWIIIPTPDETNSRTLTILGFRKLEYDMWPHVMIIPRDTGEPS